VVSTPATEHVTLLRGALTRLELAHASRGSGGAVFLADDAPTTG
jgi:hypothetical protein